MSLICKMVLARRLAAGASRAGFRAIRRAGIGRDPDRDHHAHATLLGDRGAGPRRERRARSRCRVFEAPRGGVRYP